MQVVIGVGVIRTASMWSLRLKYSPYSLMRPRVRLILALRDGEMSVSHLADIVEKTPASVSQHLAKMRLARLVATRNEGTRVFYYLENEHAQQLVTDAIFQAEHHWAGSPRHHHGNDERARS